MNFDVQSKNNLRKAFLKIDGSGADKLHSAQPYKYLIVELMEKKKIFRNIHV